MYLSMYKTCIQGTYNYSIESIYNLMFNEIIPVVEFRRLNQCIQDKMYGPTAVFSRPGKKVEGPARGRDRQGTHEAGREHRRPAGNT